MKIETVKGHNWHVVSQGWNITWHTTDAQGIAFHQPVHPEAVDWPSVCPSMAMTKYPKWAKSEVSKKRCSGSILRVVVPDKYILRGQPPNHTDYLVRWFHGNLVSLCGIHPPSHAASHLQFTVGDSNKSSPQHNANRLPARQKYFLIFTAMTNLRLYHIS